MANLLGENLVLICSSYIESISEDLFNNMNIYTELYTSMIKMIKVSVNLYILIFI